MSAAVKFAKVSCDIDDDDDFVLRGHRSVRPHASSSDLEEDADAGDEEDEEAEEQERRPATSSSSPSCGFVLVTVFSVAAVAVVLLTRPAAPIAATTELLRATTPSVVAAFPSPSEPSPPLPPPLPPSPPPAPSPVVTPSPAPGAAATAATAGTAAAAEPRAPTKDPHSGRPCADAKETDGCAAKLAEAGGNLKAACAPAYVLEHCRRSCLVCRVSPPPPPPPPRPPPPPHPPRRCGANCPRPSTPLEIVGVQASQESARRDGKNQNCVDGSRMTFCLPEPAAKGEGSEAGDGGPWLSVRVKPGSVIDTVAIFVYQPWDSDYALSPYEVHAGDSYGDTAAGGEACALQEGRVEPGHGGVPAIALCGGVAREYVTVRLTGGDASNRRMFINEVAVYAAAGPAAAAAAAAAADAGAGAATTSKKDTKNKPKNRAPKVGDVAAAINARFEAGRPSDVHAEGGVLVHVFDGYEEEARPWEVCHDVCRHGPVDTFSFSLISREAMSESEAGPFGSRANRGSRG